jgi:hypothetical protein
VAWNLLEGHWVDLWGRTYGSKKPREIGQKSETDCWRMNHGLHAGVFPLVVQTAWLVVEDQVLLDPRWFCGADVYDLWGLSCHPFGSPVSDPWAIFACNKSRVCVPFGGIVVVVAVCVTAIVGSVDE